MKKELTSSQDQSDFIPERKPSQLYSMPEKELSGIANLAAVPAPAEKGAMLSRDKDRSFCPFTVDSCPSHPEDSLHASY